MSATVQQLQPLEQEIVAVLRDRDALTTSEIHAILTSAGRHTRKSAVRTRLACLARIGVLERRVIGCAGCSDPIPTVWGLTA